MSASSAARRSIASTPATAAKSRTRRNSRPAIRGVPRARRAISAAPFVGHADPEDAGPPAHDQFQFLRRVELQADRDAEAVAQRRGEQSEPGGGADEGEAGEVDPDRARRRALADDQSSW